MCLFFSFLPATFWVVIGYFVLFTSNKAGGTIRKSWSNFGNLNIHPYLVFSNLRGYVTITDLCPLEQVIEKISR